MEKITKNELSSLVQNMSNFVPSEDAQSEDIFNTIVGIIGMPDEQFDIMAPGVLDAYAQSVNNPNDKLGLVQALNANGVYAEEVIESFDSILEQIDKLDISINKRSFLKELIGIITTAISETEGIAKRMVTIPIELCNPKAKIPQYAHISDSGMDVYALEDITIHPGETVLVPTGIKVALPPGYELQVRPKSGRALKTKLRIANTPGTIDQGYRDEIKVIVENIDPPIRAIHPRMSKLGENTWGYEPIIETDIEFGQDYTIGEGEKFCQLVLVEVPKATFYRINSVNSIGEDRGGGFGSTGIK